MYINPNDNKTNSYFRRKIMQEALRKRIEAAGQAHLLAHYDAADAGTPTSPPRVSNPKLNESAL